MTTTTAGEATGGKVFLTRSLEDERTCASQVGSVTVALLQKMQRLFDPLLGAILLNLLSQAADETQHSLF